jgi:uncharacterized membrane protein (DUF2068 family)
VTNQRKNPRKPGRFLIVSSFDLVLMQTKKGLRAVAMLEATKGALVLTVGLGLFSLIHHDVQGLAESLVRHAHLNPASHRPRIFLELAGKMNDARLWQLAAGACMYAAVRFVEAYGLWRTRRWGEWFAAVSGAVYLPFELIEFFRRPGWLSAGLFAVNLGIVLFMIFSLRRKPGP